MNILANQYLIKETVMKMQDCLKGITSTISDYLMGHRSSITSLFLCVGIGFVSAPAYAWDCKLAEGVWQRNISINNGCKYKYENVKVLINNRQVVIRPVSTGQCVPINKCSCLDDSNKPSSGPVVSSRYGHPGSQTSCEQFTRNFNLASGNSALSSNDGQESWSKNSSNQSESIRPAESSPSVTPYNLPYESTVAENDANSNSNDQPDTDVSGVGKNMSGCVSLASDSQGQYIFKNSCNEPIKVAYCVEGVFAKGSTNDAMKCGKGIYQDVIGHKSYTQGSTGVAAMGSNMIAAWAGGSVRWFACEKSSTPYLTSYNPPEGICFSHRN